MKTIFKVQRGYAIIDGIIYRKGSTLETEPDKVKHELKKGVLIEESPNSQASGNLDAKKKR